jgi:predicted transcriptional regulator
VTEESLLTDTRELATELTMAWLANPNTRVTPEDVPAFLSNLQAALLTIISDKPQPNEESIRSEPAAAVSVRKSLASKDHIISMIDGKPYKTLRRHLSRHGLTPEQYRERYGLRPDYPMVSENYSQTRRDMAKQIGLGRKAEGSKKSEPLDNAPPAKRPRGRPRKTAAA